jgi:serine/threonine protein kinase
MEAERWQKIDELFDAALEREETERGAFLSAECGGDEALRGEVEKLLRAFVEAEDFIESPALKVAARHAAGEVSPGREFGSYKIISLLGVGGMGEVYLAEDTRLRRKAALKFLPPLFLADRERVRRFTREARAVSSLNHPNIITIYDIGETEEAPYIASEYVEGQTLRERLNAGPLAFKEAAAILEQAAAALSAAHQAGIIHRDIKPENIMLRPDGYVKVLDFGLAKLLEPARVGLATASHPQETQAGLLLGTTAYMSPEQALGETVDARADVWSLGVVFYEMVTGRRPFEGLTQAAAFNAIINQPPAPFADAAHDAPEGCQPLILRALEKERELRYQTAADLRSDLKRLQREAQPANRAAQGVIASAAPAKPLKAPFKLLFAVCAAGLLAFGAWAYLSRVPPAPPNNAGPDWAKSSTSQLTTQAGEESGVNLAPDGKSFLYASRASGNWDIYWQRAGGRNPSNLTKDSPADDLHPAYSPDGGLIAFRSERSPRGIYVMEATSENARRVSDVGFNPSWSPDSKQLVVSMDYFNAPVTRSVIPSELWIIDLASGAKRLFFKGDAVQPAWSPQGRRIAYWGLQPGSGQRDLWTLPAQGGEPVAVTNDAFLDWNPVWSPDGKYLYFASNRGGSMNFWRVAIDEETGRTLAAPEAVVTPSSYSQHLSFSRDGKRLAYVQKNETLNLERVAFDPAGGRVTGAPVAITQGAKHLSSPHINADGQWLVFSSQGEQQEDIWLMKSDGSEQRQLTNDKFNDRSPQWSPDGQRIAFYSDRSGRFEIWLINPDGNGLRQLTYTQGPSAVYPYWSPDSQRINYKQRDLQPFVVEVDKPWGEQTPVKLPVVEGLKESFWVSSWSPDGQKLAGTWSVPGNRINLLHAYDFTTNSYENFGVEGARPVWLKDSRRLLYHKDDKLWLLDTQTKKTQEILSIPQSGIRTVCPSADNSLLYYSLQKVEADVWLMSLE